MPFFYFHLLKPGVKEDSNNLFQGRNLVKNRK
nr:MAG TPA: hypothetical protein [Caudoviricetes sp.]